MPLDARAKRDLEQLEKNNPEMSRAGIVRKAIRLMSEEEAIQHVLRSEQDIREGKIYRGDLRTIFSQYKRGKL